MKIISPHKKVSRLVSPDEIDKVFKITEEMFPLLNTPIGMYQRFYAIAHSQVEANDPMRFFVVNPSAMEFFGYKSIVIINPVILNHTKQEIDSEEGCASFAKLPMVKIKRYNKITVEFSPLVFGKDQKPYLGKRTTLKLSGKVAKIWLHEIDHLDAKYIYEF